MVMTALYGPHLGSLVLLGLVPKHISASTEVVVAFIAYAPHANILTEEKRKRRYKSKGKRSL
jgi:hypothetical protein